MKKKTRTNKQTNKRKTKSKNKQTNKNYSTLLEQFRNLLEKSKPLPHIYKCMTAQF